MLSEVLGLSIKKKLLNKSSSISSPVTDTLKKTAVNYMALGSISNDLKLIKLNFGRYLGLYGGKVAGKPDMHFLKDDERVRKFNVLKEKFMGSKISKASQDGTHGFTGKSAYFLKKFATRYIKGAARLERLVSVKALRMARKIKLVRQFMILKKKVLKAVNKVIAKFNFKKMISDWMKKHWPDVAKKLAIVGGKLAKRIAGSAIVSAFSGPLAPLVFGALLLGWTLYDGISEGWDEWKKSGDFTKALKVTFGGLVNSITFGIFGTDNIVSFVDDFADYFSNLAKNMYDTMKKTGEYIGTKIKDFVAPIYAKVKDFFKDATTPQEYMKASDARNQERAEQDAKDNAQTSKYFEVMGKMIAEKKARIAKLEKEIADLEALEQKGGVKTPVEQKTEEKKKEVAKEKQEVQKLEQQKPPPKPAETATKVSGMDDVKKMIIRHEGMKNKPYKDSLGLWTIGVGHLIGDGKSLPPEWNRTFSDKEIMDLFEEDFAHHVKIAEKTPSYEKANQGGKAAFIDLAFNMGQWWKKWTNTKKKLEEADFPGAAEGLKDSRWYVQVGNRAKEIVALVAQAGGKDAKPGTGKSSEVGDMPDPNYIGYSVNQKSKMVSQMQREQLKPTEYDIVNMEHTQNLKVKDNKLKKEEKKIPVHDILMSRLA